MPLPNGPCANWLTPQELQASCPNGPVYAGNETLYADCARAASEVLFEMSGRQFSGGDCVYAVRPVLQRHALRAASWAMYTWSGGSFVDDPIVLSLIADTPDGRWLRLYGHANEIVRVRIDGVDLPGTAYRLERERYLVRTDGKVWPSGQDMTADTDSPGSFLIEYKHGLAVPTAGKIAAKSLGCNFVRALSSGTCSLPENTTQVVRQGVTITKEITASLSNGHFGIPTVDAFIEAYNPTRQRRRAVVVNPQNIRRI